MPEDSKKYADIAVVGAGAAGLATAIFVARQYPDRLVVALDGAKKLGAKILVSGGTRCNVTNARVTADDFRGGNRHVINRILRAYTVQQTVEFFREIGVTLHEEALGKLFPDSNQAKKVLAALLREASARDVILLTDHRVLAVNRAADAFEIVTRDQRVLARRLVIATGGKSLPKTGSDGLGYTLVKHLGHSIVEPLPALVPLVLEGDFHTSLSGVSQDVELTVRVEEEKPAVISGAMLWTHFGVSGPVVLDASGLWERAQAEHRSASISANFLPGCDFPSAEQNFIDLAASRPREFLHNTLSTLLPARVAVSVLENLAMDGRMLMGQLTRSDRRRLVHALLAWPLPVRQSRGYNYAEVTTGGVPLEEVNPATMESRVCPGLYLVGEILDVDGRIGGFNFQWAWSTAWVAASAQAR